MEQSDKSYKLLKNLTPTSIKAADEFLKIAFDFKLGQLPTEQPAEETKGLSTCVQTDVKKAVNMTKLLDIKTLKVLLSKCKEIEAMYKDVVDTLDSGNKIYISGCGATGRLSLALEALWNIEIKEKYENSNPALYKELKGRIVSFMAGGDVALIKSVEDFEDHPEFGHQQMKDLHFGNSDLLIASTEGGETPWVIGTAEYAAQTSKRKPWLLYCNPDEILIKTVERSKKIIENKNVHKINVTVGNMGITGSTRMQSTTILMYAIGLALFGYHKILNISKEQADKQFLSKIQDQVKNFLNYFEQFKEDEFLNELTILESQIYKDKSYIFYETDYYFSLNILTDTTERSPTFSLFPFENQQDKDKIPSMCHLVLLQKNFKKGNPQETVKSAWHELLGFREFRGLEGSYWEKYKNKVSSNRGFGHDFSENIIELRKKYCRDGKADHYHFLVQKDNQSQQLVFQVKKDGQDKVLLLKQTPLTQFKGSRLEEHIFLKILLNTHSTLVMGRLNRYLSNFMTWVRPSNNKLIDRSIRYVQYLLDYYKDKFIHGKEAIYQKIDYSLICHALHSEIENLNFNQAIVLNTLKRILKDLFDYTLEEQ